MSEETHEFPFCYASDAEIEEAFLAMATRDVPIDEVAIEVLEMSLDWRIRYRGGYRADIDSTTVPGLVIVSDVGGSDDNEPELRIYSLRKLLRVAVRVRRDARRWFVHGPPDHDDWSDYVDDIDFERCVYRPRRYGHAPQDPSGTHPAQSLPTAGGIPDPPIEGRRPEAEHRGHGILGDDRGPPDAARRA